METDCIFCKIAKKEIGASVLYEDNEIIAFNDRDPQAPTHVLVIPKEHIGTANDITKGTQSLIGKMTMAAKKVAKDAGIADSGYRLVINCGKDGGQLVEHLHLHLLGGRGLGWPPG